MNIEQVFIKDIRDKKRTANGVHSKTGKNGYTGTIRFPHELLKGKAKRDYQGTGRVVKWNMYETMLTREEFDMKDTETQRAMLTRWRELYTNGEIMKQLDVSSSGSFANMIDKLNIPKKARGLGNKVRKSKPKAKPVVEKAADEKTTAPIEKKNGMRFSFNGEYSPEQIVSKLEKLGLLIDGEENKYRISLELVELEN